MKHIPIALILLFSISVFAQQEFELTLSTKGLDLIEIGIAGFTGNGADAATMEISRKLLSRDLQLTGVFHVIPEKNMALVPSPDSPENVKNCEAFLSVGAKILVTGEIRAEEGGQLLFTGVVTDTKTCKKIVTRRYRGETALLKKLIHSFADDVIFVFTGKRGITNSRIAFVSDRTGHREVYIMDYNGDDLRQLTKIGSDTIFPAVSHDRKRIAFTSYRNHNPDLFLMTVGQGIQTIYHAEGIGSTPDFSPDGKWLLFSASKDGNTDIYIYNIDKQTTNRLTHHIAIDTSPRFSPNGKEIVSPRTAMVRRASTPWIGMASIFDGSTPRVPTMTLRSGLPTAAASPTWPCTTTNLTSLFTTLQKTKIFVSPTGMGPANIRHGPRMVAESSFPPAAPDPGS